MSEQRDFWKRKLAAYLHDSPSKCLDIKTHGERAAASFSRAGFKEEEINRYTKLADWAGASADRLPFPDYRKSDLVCDFDGIRNQFHHPLTDRYAEEPVKFKFDKPTSAKFAEEIEQNGQPLINETDWCARFFAHWRFWQEHCVKRDCRMAFLPADTRIPDHTIWNHMQVVSALSECVEGNAVNAAFLKVQIGPIQDFIAQARSIRDLWSGSFLLSWLMAKGLSVIAQRAGPDAVVFPSLKGQPLVDLMLKEFVWDKATIGNTSLWEKISFEIQESAFLTPNLPNVLLAVVPNEMAKQLTKEVELAIRQEYISIGKAVWAECERLGLTQNEGFITEDERKSRYDDQIQRTLSVSWQVTPWPKSVAEAEEITGKIPNKELIERYKAFKKVFEETIPESHRDDRFYVKIEDKNEINKKKGRLSNTGNAWALMVAYLGWELDGVRQTRDFGAWGGGQTTSGAKNQRDFLNGKEEAVAGGKEWVKRISKLGKVDKQLWEVLFKHEDWVGTSTLIKRVWHKAYLENKFGLKSEKMPDTRLIAMGKNYDEENALDSGDYTDKYFAIIALDGDQIGKWVSGDNAPRFATQLAKYQNAEGTPSGAAPYFEATAKDLLNLQRLVSPSYHLQFSEALSNFALKCTRNIVEAHKGRLIYAGGDDVLAILPAQQALGCAATLRAAFRGKENDESASIKSSLPKELAFVNGADGFMTDGKPDQNGRLIPFMVPGPGADVSVGIAVAHYKHPLQDVVRIAQAAEKRAKNQHGRGAVAFSLLKRSGETIHWGAKWDGGGLALLNQIMLEMREEQVSGRFPYKVCQLIVPYLNHRSGMLKGKETHFEGASDILEKEFAHAYKQSTTDKDGIDAILGLLKTYIGNLVKENSEKKDAEALDPVERLIGLCQTAAFLERKNNESKENL